MEAGFRIRYGESSDLDGCVALAREAASRPAAAWREVLLRDLDEPEHLFVVAVAACGIVGYGRARFFEPALDAPIDTGPSGYYLTGVFVHPAYRRQGIASAITQTRLAWMSERARQGWFFANARDKASIALHRRFGFEEVTRRFSFPDLTFDGGEGVLFRAHLPS